jgi:group I intron endonuclease
MSQKIFFVYKITNQINNKIYIGKSVNPTKRFRMHIYLATNYNSKNECTKLYRAIRKYGSEQFKLEIIESFNDEVQAYKAEDFYITKFNSIKLGMNIKPGGKGGAAAGSNHPMWGKKFTTESKLRMSNSHKGKRDTPETVIKKSLSQSGSKSHLSKLNDEQVSQIKTMLVNYKRGDLTKIAKLFDVSVATISYIKSGVTWKF